MDRPGFAQVTAIVPDGPGRYSAEVDGRWTIGGKPNGGYLLAIMARAALVESGFADPLAASAHYLAPPDPGPAGLQAEVLRTGRSAGQVRVRLAQGDRPCVEALFTVGRLDPEAEPFWAGGLPALVPAEDEPVPLRGRSPAGLEVALMDEVALVLDRSTAGFTLGKPAGRGELWGSLALAVESGFDPVSLLFAVDALPPATFDLEPAGWVPTLELTAYLRAVPADGPVRVLQKAQLVDGRRVDEACFVWDRTGRLVAQATQLAAIRLG
jgi:acyl-coenzyme A thioesterase PaaI-like protein